MLKLHFKDNRQAPIWLVEERFTIGADRRNLLVADEPGISAFHAEILLQDGHHYVTDCQTDSGTFVNGQRVSGQFQLRPGDCLRLGSLELQLLDSQQAVPKADATLRWYLQVQSGEQVGKKFLVQPGSMSFGRSVKCELCFSDPELSRRHGEFFFKDNLLEIRDLASANGVYVNQKKVSTAILQPGDQVRMGSVTLLVIGPKVDIAQQTQEDEDATLFMPMVDLPKPEKSKSASRAPTANPLRTARETPAAPAPEAKAAAGLPPVAWLAGGGLVAVLVLAAILVL